MLERRDSESFAPLMTAGQCKESNAVKFAQSGIESPSFSKSVKEKLQCESDDTEYNKRFDLFAQA